MLGAIGERAHLLAGHLLAQLRLTAADHVRDGMLASRVKALALAQAGQLVGHALLGGGDRHLADRPVVLEQVDHAQVSEPRDRELRDAPERRVQVERLGQHGTRVEEQLDADALVGPLGARLSPEPAASRYLRPRVG